MADSNIKRIVSIVLSIMLIMSGLISGMAVNGRIYTIQPMILMT